MAALVLHINREMLHHGAEIALLRDLYLWGYGADERRLLVPGGFRSGDALEQRQGAGDDREGGGTVATY